MKVVYFFSINHALDHLVVIFFDVYYDLIMISFCTILLTQINNL